MTKRPICKKCNLLMYTTYVEQWKDFQRHFKRIGYTCLKCHSFKYVELSNLKNRNGSVIIPPVEQIDSGGSI